MALAVSNESIEAQIAASRAATKEFQRQLDERNAKDREKAESLVKREAEDVRIATMVLAAMSQVPMPKDGKDGVDGRHGIDGVDGIQGVRGPKGNSGKDGIDGSTGPQGVTGEIGPQGPQGIAGKDGRDGINGVDGNHGKDGAKGDRGEAGRDGIDGRHGKDGIDGRNGINGINGKKGTKGDKGPKGAAGPRGRTGASGKDGRHGKDGRNGEDGVGIKNIHTDGTALKISLTDGKVKTLTMPGSRATGKVAPIAIPEVQDAVRTPLHATGITANNVRDGLIELKGRIVQSSSGNPFEYGTSEAFMFDFNPYDETHDGSFDYDVDGKLVSKTIEKHDGTVLYTVTFSYNGTQLSSKTIRSNINNDRVTVTFSYDNDGRLTSKSYTYTV